jgi:hypothetical protein
LIMSLRVEMIVDESSAKATALTKALMGQNEVRVRFVPARNAMVSNRTRIQILTGVGVAVVSMISTRSRMMKDPPLAEATNSTPVFRSKVTLPMPMNESDRASKPIQPVLLGMSLSEMIESVKDT